MALFKESKIVEKAAHVQLCTHLEQNKLLSHSQYVFRQRRSTSTALINFKDQILENMDNGQVTGSVFLDLRKAFDTIGHLILINKLKCLGVSGKSLSRFHSYLTSQTPCLRCNFTCRKYYSRSASRQYSWTVVVSCLHQWNSICIATLQNDYVCWWYGIPLSWKLSFWSSNKTRYRSESHSTMAVR